MNWNTASIKGGTFTISDENASEYLQTVILMRLQTTDNLQSVAEPLQLTTVQVIYLLSALALKRGGKLEISGGELCWKRSG